MERTKSQQTWRRLFTALVLGLVMSVLALGKSAFAATVLPTNVTAPSPGCTFIGVNVSFLAQQQAGLERINAIRQEACREGVLNPATGQALTTNDYVAIQWSAGLEQLARLRAAEISILFEHQRPNGERCFSVNGWSTKDSEGECIAAASGSYVSGGNANIVDQINQWYGEKSDWVNQTRGVTGHYTSMIDPRNHSVGLGYVYAEGGAWTLNLAGEFSHEDSENTSFLPAQPDVIQTVEIQSSVISGWQIAVLSRREPEMVTGKTYQLAMRPTLNISSAKHGIGLSPVTWTSSDPSVATVDPMGILHMVKSGKTIITATSADGSAFAELKVKDKIVTRKKPVLSGQSLKKRKVTIRFKGLSNKQMKKLKVTGVEVQVSRKKNFSVLYKDKVLGRKASSYKFKGQKKKTYYVRFRYVCKGGFGTWSAAKKVRIGK